MINISSTMDFQDFLDYERKRDVRIVGNRDVHRTKMGKDVPNSRGFLFAAHRTRHFALRRLAVFLKPKASSLPHPPYETSKPLSPLRPQGFG
jgi:hypothetical protein